MSKKALIICLAALVTMILGVGIAVAFLYSGTVDPQSRKEFVVPDEGRYLLLPAVPADAVFVACMSDSGNAAFMLPSGFPDVSAQTVVSLHFNGTLQTLYVFDTGRASAEPSDEASLLMDFAEARNMHAEYVNCATATDGQRDVSRRSLVLMSRSETLVKSAMRHLVKSLSVMDATGFAEASAAVSGPDVMFFSNTHAKTLMAGMFSKKYASYHPFVTCLSLWTAADISADGQAGVNMTISPVFGNDPSEYMTVLSASAPGTSKISHILPSYTISALTIPMKDTEPYSTAYESYMDSKQSLQSFRKRQRDLATRAGISPKDFLKRLDVREVAKASFLSGSDIEEVNLIRINREDPLIFVGTGNKSFKNYIPKTHSWPYAGFISSVFGKYFELEDEKCFTYIDGWIVSGSLNAVEEYSSGRALSYTLLEYMENAGQKDMLASADASMVVYHSFTEYPECHPMIFSKNFTDILEPFHSGTDYCPMVMTFAYGKDGMKVSSRIPRLKMLRTKAPEFVRDTVVVIPQGPFKVKNSGTGRNNLFYQNTHGALCLQEEDGRGIWGVPFDGKLTGRACNIDYYANGKLQIIFGSGSKIYIIDRLGRFVRGFPVDLGKEIVLGPDLYDFNGKNAYNIMVLHKGNVIDMYNLKGRKPASWTSITAPETVKALPERIRVGGRSFWVVRTAIQTLIYPFNGGAPITVFKGDEMIRPDSTVDILDETSVNVKCYDGRTRTVKLRQTE